MEFHVPLDLEELELAKADRLGVKEAQDLREEDASVLVEKLADIADALGDDSTALAEQGSFDTMYRFVRDFKSLPGPVKFRVFDVLQRAMTVIVPLVSARGDRRRRTSDSLAEGSDDDTAFARGQAPLQQRNAYKMAVYLTCAAAAKAEADYDNTKQNERLEGKGTAAAKTTTAAGGAKKAAAKKKASQGGSSDGNDGQFSWPSAREAVLRALLAALTGVEQSRLWSHGVPEEAFLRLLPQLACSVLTDAPALRVQRVRAAAFNLVAEPLSVSPALAAPVAASLFQLVAAHEHGAKAAADLCLHIADGRDGDGVLASELLRELGRSAGNGLVAAAGAAAAGAGGRTAAGEGAKRAGELLKALAEALPGSVVANMVVLLPLLGASEYNLRSAVALALSEVLGAACAEEATLAAGADSQLTADASTPAAGGDARRARLDTNARDSLLDVLLERVRDVSGYTRAAALRALAALVTKHALPLSRVLAATRAAVDRLQDKTALTRKASVQLISALLEHNPYGAALDAGAAEARAASVRQWLADHPPLRPSLTEEEKEALEVFEAEKKARGGGGAAKDSEESDGDETASEDGIGSRDNDGSDVDAGGPAEGKAAGEAVDPAANEAAASELEMERQRQIRKLDFHLSTAAFSRACDEAGPRIETFLQSRTETDVAEALDFFAAARRFGLPCAERGLRRALALVWRPEEGVKKAVVETFVSVFLREAAADGRGPRLPPLQAAAGLVGLALGGSAAEVASLEEVVAQVVAAGELGPATFDELWIVASARNAPPAARAAALRVISMGAATNADLADAPGRIETLLAAALGAQAMKQRDWTMVTSACLVLQRCRSRDSVDGSGKAGKAAGGANAAAAVARAKTVEKVLQRLAQFLAGKYNAKPGDASGEAEMQQWFAAAEQALGVIFRLSAKPEVLCGSILRQQVDAAVLKAEKDGTEACPLALSRLCFVAGHVALKLLVYTEQLERRVKRARSNADDGANGQKNGKATTSGDGKGDGDSQEEQADAATDELGMAAAAEADAEDERRFEDLVRSEIVGRNLLGAIGPVIAQLVAKPSLGSHPLLRESSVLALCKFVCISSEFCVKHLDLLFIALEAKGESAAVRANVAVALGDLATRFPNEVEPYNAKIYARLRDESATVRASVLMVLTHLILNDMVKVKGHIADVALCVRDDEPRIQGMARLFFRELSKRQNNPIYNLLPDIVGRLSHTANLEAAAFTEIMGFLLGFIKKDKHSEGLVEKLCARLTAAEDPRQQRDLAYCISQLQLTDKMLRRLVEQLPQYKGALADAEVFSSFQQLAARAKKSTKTELKEVAEEWEKKLEAHHNEGKDGDDVAGRAVEAAQVKRARRRPPLSSKGVTTPKSVAKRAPRATTALASARRPKLAKFVEDSASSSDDEGESPQRAAPVAGKENRARKRGAAAAKAK